MAAVKVSDFVFKFLADWYGVRHVFLISGGGNMHLVDSAGRNQKIKYIPTHHEQAAAFAAEAYARLSPEGLGVCLVTTGPGASNAVTGALAAWLDSIPVLFLSGQIKREAQVGKTKLRQLGDQEGPTVDLAKPVTKYAVMVEEPLDIRYHLEKAVHIARSGRPGPVWLDIPLDIQGALVEEEKLRSFDPAELSEGGPAADLSQILGQVLEKIKTAKRPMFLAGSGIRHGKAAAEFSQVVEKLQIPVLSSFAGFDLIPSNHPLYFGRMGSVGQRAANFIIQNCDLLLAVGCRMNLRVVTFTWNAFARAAYKIIVDIDEAELAKKTIKPDLPVCASAKDFLTGLAARVETGLARREEWLQYCQNIIARYPPVLPEQREVKDYVHSHYFVEMLSQALPEGAVVVMGDGLACEAPYHAARVKSDQRWILNSGCAAMGYDLPAAVGACFASQRKPVVCIAGDGSSMLNLQELQTIFHHQLPVKIFIFENQGYLSIRRTQDAYFKGLHVGSDPSSGVSCPDFLKIGQAFGIKTLEIRTNAQVPDRIKEALSSPGPILSVVRINPKEELIPKLSSRLLPDGRMVTAALEDMYPFLDREELKNNMIIPLYEE